MLGARGQHWSRRQLAEIESDLGRAVADEGLEAIGSAMAGKRLAAWLNLSVLTHIKSQRKDAPPA